MEINEARKKFCPFQMNGPLDNSDAWTCATTQCMGWQQNHVIKQVNHARTCATDEDGNYIFDDNNGYCVLCEPKGE